MKCNHAEKLIIKSFDDRLSKEAGARLGLHLETCSSCRKEKAEYAKMIQMLRTEPLPDIQWGFQQRLQSRLHTKAIPNIGVLWKQWGLRMIPLSLAVMLFFAGAMLFFPPQAEELSRSGILLRDQNPFGDTLPILEENQAGNPNMALIFTALDEGSQVRRYRP